MRLHPVLSTVCVLLAATLACSLGSTGDLGATATVVAAKVMTAVLSTAEGQLAPTAVPAGATQPPPPATEPAPQRPTPPFNPFQNLTPEQEACLKAAWGDQVFQAITTFERPPTQDEEGALGQCGVMGPGGPGGQPGQPGGPPGGGPFDDRTYLTTSADGLTWAEGTLLAEKASVPEVLRTSAGVIWAYWVDFTNFTGPGTEQIGVARSADGVTWEKLGTVNFGDLGKMAPVDPDVMELPDGRLRLYFYDITVTQGLHPIYSAVSADGINYALEAGTRFAFENIYDPNVVRLPDGRYRMYLNHEDILSATSSDGGLTFTKDDGVRVEKGSVPGAIVLPDGSVRLYVCARGISVYQSTDGLSFSLEREGVVRDKSGEIICDPSVTAMPDGYLMVYKVNPGQ